MAALCCLLSPGVVYVAAPDHGVRGRFLVVRAQAGTSGASYSQVDIDKLRGYIQKLCQSTNPLGKCMVRRPACPAPSSTAYLLGRAVTPCRDCLLTRVLVRRSWCVWRSIGGWVVAWRQDYVLEDIEAMKGELSAWQADYKRRCQDLEVEQEATKDELQPLERELKEADDKIQDEVNKINTVKVR